MRIARYVFLGIFGLALTTTAAMADGNARNFGSATCREIFNCNDPLSYGPQATSCASSGLGRTADFTGAALDSNNCVSSVPSGDDKISSNVVCCTKPAPEQDGMCRMGCSLMVTNGS